MSFQYERIEPFATIPFGTIHRGCNFNQQAEVAILELFEHYREDAATLNDIWHEILPICNLKHDFLVPVVDMDKSRGWIITEMRGENLAEIARKVPLPQNVVRTQLRNILELLEFFESNKLIHGDIRPEMLTLPKNPTGKTLEQLRVRLFPSLGVSLCGEVPLAKRDPKYLAPEMLNHQFGQVSHATDLYCLGFTALELLSGPKFDSHFQRVGQDSRTAWHFWHGNASEQLPAPREIVPDLADDLNQVLSRLLKKNVSERPATAKEVVTLLADFAPEPIPLQLITGAGGGIRQDFAEAVVTTDFSTVPPPTAPPPPVNPPKKKEKNMQPSNPNQSAHKPWSKAWCDEQINKPHVLAGVAAAFLIPAIFIGLFLKSLMGDDTVPVALNISPDSAVVSIAKDTAVKKNKDGDYLFSAGKHSIKIAAEGYEPFEFELTIPDDSSGIKAVRNDKPLDLAKAIALQPRPVPVTLKILPENAKVSTATGEIVPEDGEYFLLPGTTPTLTITAEGYEEFKLDLRIPPVGADESIRARSAAGNVDLEKTIELVKIESIPPAPPVTVVEVPVTVVEVPPVAVVEVPVTVVEVPPITVVEVPPVVVVEPVQIPGLSAAFEAVSTETNSNGLFKRVKSLQSPGLEFVLIEPGDFVFGVAEGNRHWGELRGERAIIAEPFYMAVTEVSRAQYSLFLEKNVEHGQPKDFDPSQPNLPVTNVSYTDAEAFSRWIGGRLPTEKEWEYAARYPAFDVPHPWGTAPVSSELANLFTGSAAPVAVTGFDRGKSPTGLLNMVGNVSEWCSDSYRVGEGESATDSVFEDTFVIKSPSFKLPMGPEARITWRSPMPAAGADDVGFRPVVSVSLPRPL